MSDALRELYQEIILDHARHPRNAGVLADPTAKADGHNPLCGDRVTLYLHRDTDGRIDGISFEGKGCAISQASTSLMTELVKGKTKEEIDALMTGFLHLVKGEPESELSEEDREQLEVMAGVKDFPMRVKCATLPWHTLKSALSGAGVASTEAAP
ncbi:MAG: SUF system NifU family Fe-S cluster assembly protein [Alphaproteobacteria bacterium]|nr:SUF system NifU family Fe-S cluster assembly protein [Alphaproteobacteria bacterium]